MNKGILRVVSIVVATMILAAPMSVLASINPTTKETGGNHPNNRYYFDPVVNTVNTGKDNGFLEPIQ